MRANRIGFGVTVALHAFAALALLSHEPARKALLAAAPIMFELIAPPKEAAKPQPPTELPKPKPMAKAPPRAQPEPLPVVAAPADSPSPMVATAPAMTPPTPVALAAQPEAAATRPAPFTEPIFNADYLLNPAPAYPPLSRRIGEQGRVVLRVLVNANGAADDVQIRTSSNSVRLDEAAREAVHRWKFVPAKRGDEAVPAWVLIPISFRLEG